MRLKQGSRNQSISPDELQGLLKNQQVNRQYEDRNIDSSTITTISTNNTLPTRPAALKNTNGDHQAWTGGPLIRSLGSPPVDTTTLTSNIHTTDLNNSNHNFLPYPNCNNQNIQSLCFDDSPLTSPSEDQAMSLSSPEECPSSLGNVISEEESLSDLEYNESSPLLLPEELSSDEERDLPIDSITQDHNIQNRNQFRRGSGADEESEDSVFSDCDSPTDSHQEGHAQRAMESEVFEHNRSIVSSSPINNNNTPPQVTTTIINSHSINRNLFRGTSRVDQVFTETVQPLFQAVAVTCRPHPPARIKTDVISEAARVLSLNDHSFSKKQRTLSDSKLRVGRSPTYSTGSETDMDGELNSTGSDLRSKPVSVPEALVEQGLEVDINIATSLFLNNMSIPVSKESGIQCLFKEGEETRSINIVDSDDSGRVSCDREDEGKILNTLETEPAARGISDNLLMIARRDSVDSVTDNGLSKATSLDSQSLKEAMNSESLRFEGEAFPIDMLNFQIDKEFENNRTERIPDLILASDVSLDSEAVRLPDIHAQDEEGGEEEDVKVEKIVHVDTYDIQEHNFIDLLSCTDSEEEMELQREPVPKEFELLPIDDSDNSESSDALSDIVSDSVSLSDDSEPKLSIHIDQDDVSKPLIPEETVIRKFFVSCVEDKNIAEMDRDKNSTDRRARPRPKDFSVGKSIPSSTIIAGSPTPKQAVVKPFYRSKNKLAQEAPELEENDNWELVKQSNKSVVSNQNNNNGNNNNNNGGSGVVANNSSLLNSANFDLKSTRLNDSQHRKRAVKSKRNSTTTTNGQSPQQLNDLNGGDFDVYNIETAMPTIDWAAMEEHLTRAAKENDWLMRRRNDREEIRRKLAMDSDSEDYYGGERVTRKPSLTTRLQSGMNLQICFMNETASDLDSQGSDQDSENGNPISGSSPVSEHKQMRIASSPLLEQQETQIRRNDGDSLVEVPNNSLKSNGSKRASICSTTSSDSESSTFVPWKQHHPLQPIPPHRHQNGGLPSEQELLKQQQQRDEEESENAKRQRPSFFFSRQKSWRLGQLKSSQKKEEVKGQKRLSIPTPPPLVEDFLTRHARLQAEARHALSQAKEMARMQMEVERQRKKKSPIADIIGIPFPDSRHRLTRPVLTDMNVAQLQVIVNDLHSQIESLNEDLVRLLLERDDLNMEQDSMLVDIEDMTRFLGAKDDTLKAPSPPPKMAGIK